MSSPPSPRRLWWLMVVFVGCYFSIFALFPGLLRFIGVNSYGVWFLDSYALLASNDALGIGRDAYSYNPLDPLGRPHVYSHWWLHLRDLGLTRAQNFQLGASFVLLFLIAAVSRLRPREPREILWYLGVLCSPPVLLALNRANNDLVIFALLAPVVPCLLATQRVWRWLAIPLLALATGLKYYPAVAALLLLAGANAREVRRLAFGGFLALALVGIVLAPDLMRIGGNEPKAEGLMTFGAVNVLTALGLHSWHATAVGAAMGALVIVWFFRAKFFSGWTIASADRGTWFSFVLGAILLAGCFFMGRNFAYRWVFALWLAPLLWRLPRDSRAPVRVRRLGTLTAALLVAMLWLDPFASGVLGFFRGQASPAEILDWADRIFLCEQPLTWAFFGCLLGFLMHFAESGVRLMFTRDASCE